MNITESMFNRILLGAVLVFLIYACAIYFGQTFTRAQVDYRLHGKKPFAIGFGVLVLFIAIMFIVKRWGVQVDKSNKKE